MTPCMAGKESFMPVYCGVDSLMALCISKCLCLSTYKTRLYENNMWIIILLRAQPRYFCRFWPISDLFAGGKVQDERSGTVGRGEHGLARSPRACGGNMTCSG